MSYLWVAGLEKINKNETQSVWSGFASVVGGVYKKKGVFIYVQARWGDVRTVLTVAEGSITGALVGIHKVCCPGWCTLISLAWTSIL